MPADADGRSPGETPSPGDGRRSEATDFDRRMRRETLLTWTARALMFVGVVIVAQHLVAHAGYRGVPLSMGAQDLLIGYPTGALVMLLGVLIWGRNPSR